ncbi:hypothetical protein [Defluviimonas sp. SAOS-178_SWC]|uniref:hypothetical protein n=1 Tax=Defluviimonas sp. SAOS-178_SWC TaxID=3121287 RepID=UPI00322154DA
MDRSERIGMIISGGAHLAAILWLIVGGIFFSHDLPPPVATAEVTLMSEAEFSALQAAAPKAATEAPPAPSVPEPPAAEETPEAPVAETPPEPAKPAEPEPQPEPDVAPDVTELAPPETVVEDTPPTPPATPVESPADPLPTEAQPDPKAAPRVAPEPTVTPAENADVAPEAVAETTPEPSPEPTPVEPEEATAPPETGQVLETEANKDQTELASAAPQSSVRPKSKPEKPKPAPEPAPAATETAAAPEPQAPSDDAMKQLLAEAMAGEQSDTPAPGTGTAPSGPPMTGGEKDALVIAVKQCWNVGALSTDALNTVVTVGVSMDQSGMPVSNSIRMIGYEGGNEAAARQAYEAGRRAIIRCAKTGYPLPPEKYEQWREVEIVFNPEKMRMK